LVDEETERKYQEKKRKEKEGLKEEKINQDPQTAKM